MKIKKGQRMSDSKPEVIIHAAGVHTTMDGGINKALDAKHSEIYENIHLYRESRHINIGDCIIQRIDKTYFVTIFPALYDYDSIIANNVNVFDSFFFTQTLEHAYEIMKGLGLTMLKIAAPNHFGVKGENKYIVDNAVKSIFRDCDFTFFKEI